MLIYKDGSIVVATTNRAPLVRGKTYQVESTKLDWPDAPVKIVGLDFAELASDFRPAEWGEYAEHIAREKPMVIPPVYCGSTPVPTPAPDGGVTEILSEAGLSPGASALGAPQLPDGNPKTRFGVAKPPIGLVPGLALVQLSTAFRDGAAKYGPANWRIDPVTASTYVNAALRHITSWVDGETDAEDSGVHHLAHAAACLCILLDAEGAGTLNDDRPPPAPTSALIKSKTHPIV